MIINLDTDEIRLVSLTNDPGHDSHRFGGRAPAGFSPKYPNNRYLLTIGVEDELYISMYLTGNSDYFIFNSYTIYEEGQSFVEVIFHGKVSRREDDPYTSTFTSSHAIAIGPLQKDEHLDGAELIIPEPANKLGGEAFIIETHSQYTDMVNIIKERGFHQSLQWDASSLTSGGRVNVTGTDAYGLGIMHFYLKYENSQYEWCCFFQN